VEGVVDGRGREEGGAEGRRVGCVRYEGTFSGAMSGCRHPWNDTRRESEDFSVGLCIATSEYRSVGSCCDVK
jgi:hypothetical protein